MASRLDKALATVSGASVALGPEGSALVPGEEAQLAAIVANAGMAEIQIKQLKFRGLGVETKLDAADKMLPGTETAAEVKVATPKNAQLECSFVRTSLRRSSVWRTAHGSKLSYRSKAFRSAVDNEVAERRRAGR